MAKLAFPEFGHFSVFEVDLGVEIEMEKRRLASEPIAKRVGHVRARWLCKAVGMLKSLPFGRRKVANPETCQ